MIEKRLNGKNRKIKNSRKRKETKINQWMNRQERKMYQLKKKLMWKIKKNWSSAEEKKTLSEIR